MSRKPFRPVAITMLILVSVLFMVVLEGDRPDEPSSRVESRTEVTAKPPTDQDGPKKRDRSDAGRNIEHGKATAGTQEIMPSDAAKGQGGTSAEMTARELATKSSSLPLHVKLEKDHDPWWKDTLPNLISLAAIVVAGLTLWLNASHNQRTLLQKAHEEEIKDIQEKLNTFYGPVRQLLATSERLTELFKVARAPKYRTLIALIEGVKFDGNDGVLLKQIIDVTQQVDELIVKNSGLIDGSLQPLMAKASTHFRLMRLAHEGHLKGEANRFSEVVYPNELNARIDDEILRLQSRITELNTSVTSRPRRNRDS